MKTLMRALIMLMSLSAIGFAFGQEGGLDVAPQTTNSIVVVAVILSVVAIIVALWLRKKPTDQ